MTRREERIGGQRLILGDCRDIIGGLSFDAICTDPPYGIDVGNMNMGVAASSRLEKKDWDNVAPDLSILPPVQTIIWGGNYFDLPASRGFLVWYKGGRFDGRSFAECEMAWTNIDMSARHFHFDQAWEGLKREHKTQKPVALMEWCLGFLPNAQTILDPFMGSGTTLVACQRLGRNGIGIELDPDYFEIACKRVDEATRQPDLLIPAPAPQPVQEGLDL